jgi:hypothetical protein
MHKREIKQELRHQQQQVQDFNNRFQKEKQRKPTLEEVSNNFDNLIPLNIILLPVCIFIISSFVTRKSSCISISSIFSMNSGMIEIPALTKV